jgi:hypothetical protein
METDNVEKEIKETFKEMSLKNSFQRVTFQGGKEALSMDLRVNTSLELKRPLVKEAVLIIRKERLGDSGETFKDKFEKLKLPLNLTKEDWANIANAYALAVKESEKKYKELLTDKGLKSYKDFRERREEFAEYAEKLKN